MPARQCHMLLLSPERRRQSFSAGIHFRWKWWGQQPAHRCFDHSGNQPGLGWVNLRLWEKCAGVQCHWDRLTRPLNAMKKYLVTWASVGGGLKHVECAPHSFPAGYGDIPVTKCCPSEKAGMPRTQMVGTDNHSMEIHSIFFSPVIRALKLFYLPFVNLKECQSTVNLITLTIKCKRLRWTTH